MNTRWLLAAELVGLVVALGACRMGEKRSVEPQSVLAPEARLVEVYADGRFFEGPAWSPSEGMLYFTAFGEGNQQVLRLEKPGVVTVWMDRTEGVNGMFRARDGRLLGAQTYGHRVLSTPFGGDAAADVQVLAADPTWNQPNDVCQAPNGHIYFTDPDFQAHERSGVYHLTPDGVVTKVADDMQIPNGIVVSNDGSTLYVGDSNAKHWRAYPILPDGSLGPGPVFFDPEVEDRSDPDGMTIDVHGNLYFTGRGGVWAVRPSGAVIEFIPVPEFCSNLTFGGTDGRTLFVTCKGKVYSLEMAVRGGPSGGWW